MEPSDVAARPATSGSQPCQTATRSTVVYKGRTIGQISNTRPSYPQRLVRLGYNLQTFDLIRIPVTDIVRCLYGLGLA